MDLRNARRPGKQPHGADRARDAGRGAARGRTTTRAVSATRPCRTADEALAFVEARGAVLVSARSDAPSLVEAIAGAPIAGSWWGHPEGHRIFEVLNAVTDSDQVLVCRLLGGKLTLVHRRLWPALARLAGGLAPGQVAQVRQEHTTSGRHVNRELPFPHWVPAAVLEAAGALTEAEAAATFGDLLAAARARPGKPARSARARPPSQG